jgi:hypothetical protein
VIRACFARYGPPTLLVAALLAGWAGTSSGDHETKLAARGYIAEQVASANAHPDSGTLAFPGRPAATQPPTTQQPSPTAAPTSTQRTRMPAWLKLVIGLVAIIFAVQVARRATGRGSNSRP